MSVITESDASTCGMTVNMPRGEAIVLLADTGSTISKGDVLKIGYDTTLNKLAAVALTNHGSSTVYSRIVVAAERIVDGDYGRFYIRGCGIPATVASGTYTADQALKIHDGTVTSLGVGLAYANTEFGVCEAGGTSTTSITITLLGRESLETT